MRLKGFAGGLLILVALGASPALGEPAPATPPPTAPKKIYVGVYLHDVTKFDQKDGVFDVDLELWAKWLGDFDPETISLANQREATRELVKKESDGAWHSVRWRVRGTLRGEFPLQKFPFDAQTLAVTVELPDEHGELVPDLASSGMRNHFSVTGWHYEPQFRPRVSSETFRSDLGSVRTEGQPTMVRRVAFEVVLRRPLLMVALKLFLPLLIIVLVSMIALFLPAEQVEARSSIGVTALLSCFAFQFTIAGSLPDVVYLTVADSLFMEAYLVTSSALVLTIVAYFLVRRGQERGALRLDRAARMVLFLGAVVPAGLLLRAPKPVPPPAAPALAQMPRTRSARDRLRIGTTLSLQSQLSAPGQTWGVIHREPDGTRHPVFVDAMPGVSSDTMRFLAGGELEIAWRLRPGVKWSDGAPLTARDLQFSFEASRDPLILDVRVERPDELVLRYRDRVAQALVGFTPDPRHALETVFKTSGYEAMREHARTKPTPTLGPYRVAAFVPNQRITLEANPHFLGPPPNIRQIEMVRFEDGAALMKAFEAGELDTMTPNSLTPEEARALATRHPEAVRIRPSSIYIFLHPDLAHPLIGKLQVRRALLQAIDRERLRSEVHGPEGRVAHIPVTGPLPEGTVKTPYDPAQARALLQQHGALGASFPLYIGKKPVDRMMAERIGAQLRAVGLTIEVKEVADTAKLYRERKHGGLLLYVMSTDRESSARLFWNLPRSGGQYQPNARHDAYTDAVAALVEREIRALYPERREQLRDRLFVAYSERLPNLPLVFGAERTLATPTLRGWDHGEGSRFGDGIEQWFFAADVSPAGKPRP